MCTELIAVATNIYNSGSSNCSNLDSTQQKKGRRVIPKFDNIITNNNTAAVYTVTLKVMAALIVTICLLRITVELFQLFIYSGEYLTSWVNLIEGFLYFGTIVFVLSDYEFCYLINWRWQLGAFCIFLSWINFVLFLSQEPTFGIYVIMLEVMIKTFLKTIPMTALLILAFGQPFYMLLSPVTVNNEEGKASYACSGRYNYVYIYTLRCVFNICTYRNWQQVLLKTRDIHL